MINDRELVLYIYRDGLSEARTRVIARALQVDAGLRRRLNELEMRLNGVRPAPTPAPPSAHRRWHAALAEAAGCDVPEKEASGRKLPVRVRAVGPRAGQGPWRRLFPLPLAAGLALVLVLALGVVIGLQLSSPGAPDRPPRMAGTAPPEPAVTHAMVQYLAETGQQLMRLDGLAAAERAVLVDEIFERNRLYVKAAERAEWPELARALRAFGVALAELGDDTRADHPNEALRAQLSFELNALQTRIDRRPSKQTNSI